MAKNKHNRTRSILFIHMKTPSVTIQGNLTVMRYHWRHSVGSSSYPCQSRYDVGTRLGIMSRG